MNEIQILVALLLKDEDGRLRVEHEPLGRIQLVEGSPLWRDLRRADDEHDDTWIARKENAIASANFFAGAVLVRVEVAIHPGDSLCGEVKCEVFRFH